MRKKIPSCSNSALWKSLSDGICRYDKHTVNTRDELSGVDVMTLPEAQEASEQWQSVSNYYTEFYFIHEEKNSLLPQISTWALKKKMVICYTSNYS